MHKKNKETQTPEANKTWWTLANKGAHTLNSRILQKLFLKFFRSSDTTCIRVPSGMGAAPKGTSWIKQALFL
ncbi:hypothetical protein CAB17_05670 [Legionella sainthelensi]|uniref:Uncharacterized protein n=1 Tax=Legionella sainthelensi TaxID=28087 RepID=A0A2H5FJ78_9GAMM|nr:hypothetical protein CAB17_05670 [Legionella sainthelensi]